MINIHTEALSFKIKIIVADLNWLSKLLNEVILWFLLFLSKNCFSQITGITFRVCIITPTTSPWTLNYFLRFRLNSLPTNSSQSSSVILMRPTLRFVLASTAFAELSWACCLFSWLQILAWISVQGGQISPLGVDVNELILELAFSPVRDPIPWNLKKRNSVT